MAKDSQPVFFEQNIEIAKALNVTVTAGSTSTVISQKALDNYKNMYAYAVSPTSHTWTLKIEHTHTGTAGMFAFADGSNTVNAAPAARANTGQVVVKSKTAYVTITNSDAADKAYDVYWGGFRT